VTTPVGSIKVALVIDGSGAKDQVTKAVATAVKPAIAEVERLGTAFGKVGQDSGVDRISGQLRDVERASSDLGASLSKAFDLKPAMTRAEGAVDRSVSNMRSSLKSIDSGVSGIAVAAKLRPELERAEQVVDSSVDSMSAKLANISVGIAGAFGGIAQEISGAGAAAAAAGAAAGAGFVSGFGGPIAALGSAAGPVGIALAATAGIGLLAGKALADAVFDGMGQLNDQANVAAKMGLTPEQMAPLGAAASEAYAQGFGESVNANMDTIRAAVQGGILDPNANAADVEKIVAQLNTVATVTGEEIPAAVRTAQQAVRTGLATDVTGALDLITRAQQQGLNVSGDLFDTINEYGTQFRKLGLDGADAFGLISQLVKGGARDTDVAADAIKEFSIRAIDGSKLTTAAYENLGLSAKATTDAFAAGGDTAKNKFQEVIDRIAGIADPAQRAQIQVALFGTQAEDLGNSLNNLNLSSAAAQFGEVGGAAQKASDTLSNTAAAQWESAKRTIETAANSVKMALAEVAGPALKALGDWVIANRAGITDFFFAIASAAVTSVDVIGDVMGGLLKTLGQVVGGFGNVQGAVLKFQAWQADVRGDKGTADELRRQAEEAFKLGEGVYAAGAAMGDFDGTAMHKSLDEAAAKARGAAGETAGFGTELGKLPTDGVNVPLAVTGIPEASTEMDAFFARYRELKVGVELGDTAAFGVDTGGLLGAGVDASGFDGSARDFAHNVMMPIWEQQGFTTGDHPDPLPGGIKYGEHQNGAVDVMVDSIAEGQKVLAQAIRDPNAYGIIFNNQTYGYGNDKNSPQDYTAGHTGDPTQDHQDHVHIWYKPTDLPPGMSMPSMPGGLGNTAGVPLAIPPGGVPLALPPAPPPPPGMPPAPKPAPGTPPTPAPGSIFVPTTPTTPGATTTAPTVAPPPVPTVTVPQQTVAVIPLTTPTSGDPVQDAIQGQLDNLNNTIRASDASKAVTDAAQNIADAQADVETARIARDAALIDTTKTNEEKAKAEQEYQDSLKDLTKAQNDQAEVLQGQERTNLQDQLTNRRNQTTKAKPFDYDSLPMGDPSRAAAAALSSLGAKPQDIAAILGGANPLGAAAAPISAAAGAAGGPLGGVLGGVVADALSVPLPGPMGYQSTPTAPSSDLNALVQERNPLALAQAAGIDVPDYTRQGGGGGEVQQGNPATDANGRIYSDTAALIDRTFTNLDASERARHDQTMAVLNEIKASLGQDVFGPAVGDATTTALQEVAAQIGESIGQTAAPPIAAAVKAAVPADSGSSGGASGIMGAVAGIVGLPGMAAGGSVTGGTPGKDSVPAMLMPGEFVLTTAEVQRLGGFAGVERFRSALGRSGGMRYYAAGGNVGGKDGTKSVGGDFFGISEVPVIGGIINLLINVLLKIIGVQIEQRDTLMQMSAEARAFRGAEFRAFDAVGRIYNDTTGLTDRSSTSDQEAADERIRILKLVIEGIIKFVIEKVVVPISKAVANTVIQAGAGAASGALNTVAPGAGNIVGSLITSAGQVGVDVGADVYTVLAESIASLVIDTIGEALSSSDLGNALFGGGSAAVIDPIAGGLSGSIGGITAGLSSITAMLASLFGAASFDTGGLATGVGFMPKATIQPERVLSPTQTRAFDRLVATLERGTPTGQSRTIINAPFTVNGDERGARIVHDRLLALTS
jgi:phage-related minor tail protein